MSNSQPIASPALHSLLLASEEIALLDVREARIFNAGHLNLARHAPLSTLELRIGRLVPRLNSAVVLLDDDNAADGAAARAAGILARLGYHNVRRLEGGLRAWRAAGLPVTDGYNTLVKAFADLAREHYETPVLQVAELAKRSNTGLPTTIIDARPRAEYQFLTIAGARNYPGTELALRRYPADDPQHLLAISCFSRTRGIIGTTTLRLLGLSEQAAFVEDGVMEWGLQGLPLEQNAAGPDDIAPLPEQELHELAENFAARYALPRIDAAGLQRLRQDSERTTYLFDVRRTAPDRADSSVRSVAGGQLLMHYENYIGVRHPRIVLIDDPHRLRATITAFWLTQLNQAQVFILDADVASADVPDLHVPTHGVPEQDAAPSISAASLLHQRDSVAVIDVGASIDFEREHIAGAYFLLPASLAPLQQLLQADQTLVFTSPDGTSAELAARDARALWPEARIAWLAGGTQQWKLAGLKVEAHYEAAQLLTPFDDDWGSVMRVFGPRRDEAWKAYLDWETTFGARVATDRTVQFRWFEHAPGGHLQGQTDAVS